MLSVICVNNALLLMLAVSWANGASLMQNSPFVPPDYKKTAKTPERKIAQGDPESTRFALKGVSKLGSEYLFSIYDSVTQKSEWIQAGVSFNGFIIESYDPRLQEIEFRLRESRGKVQLARYQELEYQLVAIPPKEVRNKAGTALISPQTKTANRNIIEVRKVGFEDGTKLISKDESQSASKINFTVSHKGKGTGSSFATDNGNNTNKFASANPMPENQSESALVASSRINPLSIFPRTTVENPNGKIPDHLR